VTKWEATAAMAATQPPRLTVVWVYGTLKRGFANHTATNLVKAAALGAAVTLDRFPLLTLSRFHVPFLLDAPGHGRSVSGELYAVDPTLLAELDALEGHPDWYARREISVCMVQGGGQRIAQGYLLPATLFQTKLLELPDSQFQDAYLLEDHLR
jgi:gamma-glutamylaminecyclotransferase